jgi:hypothetical protein
MTAEEELAELKKKMEGWINRKFVVRLGRRAIGQITLSGRETDLMAIAYDAKGKQLGIYADEKMATRAIINALAAAEVTLWEVTSEAEGGRRPDGATGWPRQRRESREYGGLVHE